VPTTNDGAPTSARRPASGPETISSVTPRTRSAARPAACVTDSIARDDTLVCVTMSDPHGELAPGARLGRYVLLLPIGTGGMGAVWIAEHAAEHDFKRIVALKLIRREHAADAAFRAMFLSEARVAARLSHANVARTVDLGEERGQLYQ